MPKLIIDPMDQNEVPVTISLEKYDDRVRVNAQRGPEGDEWVLLDILEDGSYILHGNIGKDLGFKLDKNGRLIASK